jgi:hypothetical protein
LTAPSAGAAAEQRGRLQAARAGRPWPPDADCQRGGAHVGHHPCRVRGRRAQDQGHQERAGGHQGRERAAAKADAQELHRRGPWAQLGHYARYLKAITSRLDKYRADPARDAAKLKELLPLEQRYWRLVAERKGQVDARMQEYRWMLEELRVSFLPRAAHAVSGQRQAAGQGLGAAAAVMLA